MRYRGILLDMDGTLVDSNDAHARAWHRAFADNGQPVPYDEIRRRVGMGGDNLIAAAGSAGLGVIAFRCGGFSDEDLTGALAIYDGPADLLEQWEESPLG